MDGNLFFKTSSPHLLLMVRPHPHRFFCRFSLLVYKRTMANYNVILLGWKWNQAGIKCKVILVTFQNWLSICTQECVHCVWWVFVSMMMILSHAACRWCLCSTLSISVESWIWMIEIQTAMGNFVCSRSSLAKIWMNKQCATFSTASIHKYLLQFWKCATV